jgi:DNA-binding GntR family transcriptional regulator
MVLLINTVRDAVSQYGPLLAHLTVTREQVVEHHEALLDALEKRNSDRAAAIADEYLARGARHVADLIESGKLATGE